MSIADSRLVGACRGTRRLPSFPNLRATNHGVSGRCVRWPSRIDASTCGICPWPIPTKTATFSLVSQLDRSSTLGSQQSNHGYRGEPSIRSEFPIFFFCFDVLLHELRDHLVFQLQLLFKPLDLALRGIFNFRI